MNNKVSIVLICDDNYIVPTSVAIASLIKAKEPQSYYKINIVAASLTSENEAWFHTFSQENVEINIIRQDANRFKTLHTFQEGAICVASIAALLKFVLPELLPDDDKVLYLDGDILVKEDLTSLFNTNIKHHLAGVVIDSGSIYYKHKFVQMVEHYFNSGVMLLNLKQFREENITAKLIETKTNLTDSNLMDQNVFNIVLNNRIKLLPIRYNFLPVNLQRADAKWTIDQINAEYQTNYKSKTALFEDGAIIHYSSKDKPWKVSNAPFSADWYKVYLSVDFNSSLSRYTLGMEDDSNQPKVSVIIPVYNVENYLSETMECVLSQTLSEIEIICINDGSTDQSQTIIENYQKKDKRIKLINKENEGQAIARNIGIEMAKGAYIYFMDSDDLIAENCLERLYTCSQENNLDLLLFDGTSFFENNGLEEDHANYKVYYQRKKRYYGVHDGQDMYSLMVNAGDHKVSPCLQFLRTEYVHKNNICFPPGIIHEDNLLAYYAVILADRVMHIPDILFFRRVRTSSTMTTNLGLKNFIGYYVCCYEMIKFVNSHKLSHFAEWNTNRQICGYLNKAKNIYDNYLTDEEKNSYMNNEMLHPFSFDMLISVYNQANSSVKLESQVREQQAIIQKYEKALAQLDGGKAVIASQKVSFKEKVLYIKKVTLRYMKENGLKATIKRIFQRLKQKFFG